VLLRALHQHGASARGEEVEGRDHVDYLFGLGGAGDEVLPRIVQFVREPASVVAAPSPAQPRRVAVDRDVALDRQHVDRWRPEAPERVLVLAAVGEQERTACGALATALAPHGVEVLVVPCGERAELSWPASPHAFASAMQQIAEHRRANGSTDTSVYVGGLGRGGWLASLAGGSTPERLRIAGRILFAAPAGRASLVELLPAARGSPDLPHAAAAFAPEAPLLSITGTGDSPAMRKDAEALATRMLAPGSRNLGVEIAGTSTVAALRGAGAAGDQVVPIVLAFLGL
jgi:hypothetical protein